MSFKIVPIYRGFTEIKLFFELCQRHNAVICGGYARYCASPRPTPEVIPAGDVDIFPHDEAATKAIQEVLLAMGFEIRHENHVSITLKAKKENKAELGHYPTPQIIKPVVEGSIVAAGTTETILENFDFTVVRAAILSPETCLVDEDFLEDEEHKVLRIKNIHCPISSLLRCCKYVRKGYFLRPLQALKLFVNWTDRGDDYRTRIIELFSESGKGKQAEDNPDGMTQKEIDELEKLLRID